LTLSQQIVQAAHAAIQATNLFPSKDPNLVVCEVANIEELGRASDRLKNVGIDCAAFFEPDDDLGFTALATGPLKRDQRRFLKGFRSWRE
jgi:hypothetical protein